MTHLDVRIDGAELLPHALKLLLAAPGHRPLELALNNTACVKKQGSLKFKT